MKEDAHPPMPINAAEFLAETVDLNAEEFAVYQRLTLHLWLRGGSLPDDPARLAAFAHVVEREAFDRAWLVVRRFFTVQGGTVTRQRLVQDLERARARMVSTAEKGRKGGLISGGVRRQALLPGLEAQLQAGPTAQVEAGVSTPARAREKISLRKSGSGSSATPSLRSGPSAVFSRVVSDFSALWATAYGRKYHLTAQDRSHLGRTLGEFPSTEAIEAYDWRGAFTNYLADMDKFVAGTQRHSLAWFCSRGGVNKYAVADRTVGFSDRELRSIQAGAKFDEVMASIDGGQNGRTR